MKKLILVTLPLFLTGCAGLNSDFSCSETAEGSCISVSDANKLGSDKISNKIIFKNQSGLIAENNNNDYFRTKESVYKIYINDYIDENDNLHKEQTIYFTLTNPTWQGY